MFVQYANESPVTCMLLGGLSIATVHFPGSVGMIVRYDPILSAIVATLVPVLVSGAIG